jgi:hypothetical protein
VRPRAREYIGRIRVLVTDPDRAVAQVTELLVDKTIKEGDCVSTRTPPVKGERASSGAGRKE